MKLKLILRAFHQEETGQDMLEYALVLFAVMAAVAAGSDPLSKTIDRELKRIMQEVKTLKIPR